MEDLAKLAGVSRGLVSLVMRGVDNVSDLHHAADLVPVVSLGAAVEGVDSVVNDAERGAALVVEHLADLGHTDIVHIEGGDRQPAKGRDGSARCSMSGEATRERSGSGVPPGRDC